jgi:hypothetical protein
MAHLWFRVSAVSDLFPKAKLGAKADHFTDRSSIAASVLLPMCSLEGGAESKSGA